MKKYLLFFISTLFLINLNSQSIPNEGIVAYFPFNGNANDASGNENHGTVFGATPIADRFGNKESAYHFDGVDDYIESTSSPFNFGYGPFTFSAWINVESIDFKDYRWGTIIEKNNYGVGHKSPVLLFLPDSTISFGAAGWYSNPEENIKGTTKLDFNKWYHIVGVRDVNSQKIYINGRLTASGTETNLNSGNSYNLRIGRRQQWVGDEDGAFTGAIDDIRIYDRALSESEIYDLFHEGGWNPNHPRGLVAYYPFNGNADDESGNGNDGIVSGAVLTSDRFGSENSAYIFDGDDDQIQVNSSPPLGDFTYSIWFNATSADATGWHQLVSSWFGSYKDPLRIAVRDNKLVVDVQDVISHQANSEDTIKNNRWYHVVAVKSNNTLSSFLNGKLIKQTMNVPNPFSGGTPMKYGFGASVHYGIEHYNGLIDDIRIYDRALTESEISDLYHEGGWTGPEEIETKIPFGTYSGYSYGIAPSQDKDDETYDEYLKWKADFVSDENANGFQRVKYENEGKLYTASEGIGYGMLLAAYSGDKILFDDFVRYYSHYKNSNGLMCWKIPWTGEKPESNMGEYYAAIDGDQDVAMALILASYQWGNEGQIHYTDSAKIILESIMNFGVEDRLIMPGDVSYVSEDEDRTDCIDPSYFAPAYYPYFYQISGNSEWLQIRNKTLKFLLNNGNHATGLIGDWCDKKGDAPICAERETNYWYDASRIPWRFGMDYLWHGNKASQKICEKIQAWTQTELGEINGHAPNIVSGYSTDGTRLSETIYNYKNNPIVAGLQTGAMVLPAYMRDWLDELIGVNLQRTDNVFYNRTIKVISLFVASGNFWPIDDETFIDELNFLSIKTHCPVDLEVINKSNGDLINKSDKQILNSLYIEMDQDGDGDLDDEIFIVEPGNFEYDIVVSKEPGASETDTFSLIINENGIEKTLVDNEKIANIPDTPYTYKAGNLTSANQQQLIGNQTIQPELKIYPNPFNNVVTIHFEEKGLKQIEIYSNCGKLIYFTDMKGIEQHLDLNHIDKGLYFITLISNENMITKKMMKL